MGRSPGIAQPLNSYWDARGLTEEAQGWVDRARDALESGDGTPPALDSPGGALWLFIVGAQAARQTGAAQLDAAETTYHDILTTLENQPASKSRQQRLAVTYHQLGVVAEDRRRFDDAEDWYRRSLTIEEELGDRSGQAMTYHQLGIVAYLRRRLDDAEDWYRRALTIHEELGNRPHQAATYHQLGIAAQDRRRLDDAEDWYRHALTIEEELGNRPHQAATYHQLGIAAYLRGRLDDAEDLYRHALTVTEELQDRPGLAMTYGQLGLLAEARHRPGDALEWMVRGVAVFDEFPHPATGPGPAHLARLTGELGIDALAHCWQNVTGRPLPQAVRDFVASTG